MVWLLLSAALQQIYIGGPEPGPADPWVQSVEGTCGRARIRIAGFGAARPLARPAIVEFNSRAATGKRVGGLKRYLSARRAAYRFEILCSRTSPEITVRIHRGIKQPGGPVEFVNAVATFRNGRLVDYLSEPVGADSFWYR